MTTICALALPDRGETWLGSDSRLTGNDGLIYPINLSKWRVVGSAAVGTTGEGRTYSLVQKLPDGAFWSPEAMCESLRKMVKDDGWNSGDNPGAPSFGVHFLFAMPGSLFDIDSTFDLEPIATGIVWASGSGMRFAVGCDYGLRHVPSIAPANRIQWALEAAAAHDTGTGGVFTIHRLSKDQPHD